MFRQGAWDPGRGRQEKEVVLLNVRTARTGESLTPTGQSQFQFGGDGAGGRAL